MDGLGQEIPLGPLEEVTLSNPTSSPVPAMPEDVPANAIDADIATAFGIATVTIGDSAHWQAELASSTDIAKVSVIAHDANL